MADVTRACLGVNFLCVGGAADGGGRGILRRECGLTLSTRDPLNDLELRTNSFVVRDRVNQLT